MEGNDTMLGEMASMLDEKAAQDQNVGGNPPEDNSNLPKDLLESKDDSDVDKEAEEAALLNEIPADAPSRQELAKDNEKRENKVADIDSTNESAEKPWYMSDDDATDTSKKEDEVVEDPNELAAEYKEILSDPHMKALIAAKKAGKNIFDYIEDVKPIDYEKMPDEKLIEMEAQALGLVDDDADDFVAEYTEGPKWKLLQKAKEVREKLQGEQGEKLNGYAVNTQHQIKQREQNVQRSKVELEQKIANLEGSELFGLTITPEIGSGLKDSILNEYAFGDGSGGIDVEKSVRLAVWMKYGKDLVQANINRAKNSAKDASYNEITRPNRNDEPSKSVNPILSDEAQTKKDIMNYLDRKANEVNPQTK